MTPSKVTRFRAYQLGTSGSSFSYFADGHFTVIEARLTGVSAITMAFEMGRCQVARADVLHITSWDDDHCAASEIPALLKLIRPISIELPGYPPGTENAKGALRILKGYLKEAANDNQIRNIRDITPEYISSLECAKELAFQNIYYNPLFISQNCGNDNSTVKYFRRGIFNVLSLGDVESSMISARLSRARILCRETDVMILAHHGADNGFTTKKFLRHIEPRLAICSSDYGNQYDHPRQEIRDLLFEEGVRLMTTKTGDVLVKSLGDHAGNCIAINFKSNSTEESSKFEFVAKKKRLLGFNNDTFKQLYAPTPPWRRAPK